jgi:hypothetical protein
MRDFRLPPETEIYLGLVHVPTASKAPKSGSSLRANTFQNSVSRLSAASRVRASLLQRLLAIHADVTRELLTD